jgi:hypothetical protein
MRPLWTHTHSVKPIELSIFSLQCDCLCTVIEVAVAVRGFIVYAIWRNYFRDKCLLEDTASSPTVGLFEMGNLTVRSDIQHTYC